MSLKEFCIEYDDCGAIFCMPVENENYDIISGNEKVVDENEVTIVFDYPLEKSVEFNYKSKNGFTRREFWKCISEGYNTIYRKEKKSNGSPYGIWGHDIGDLTIDCVFKQNGKYFLDILS